MEKAVAMLRSFGRFRELETILPKKKQARKEENDRLREAGLNAAQAKWELDKAEKGGFFRRLMGKSEEKKELAYAKYREAMAQEQQAKQRVALLTMELEAMQQEYENCSGSWEIYLAEKEHCVAVGYAPEKWSDVLYPVLREFALWEIGECLDNLESARHWMQEDIRRQRVLEENRKLEFLGNARKHAQSILRLLEQLPEGSVEITNYLRDPDGFILNMTMLYKQLDKLNLAQDQLRRLRKQLQEQ